MAIPASGHFWYSAVLTRDEDGGYVAKAASLQAASGGPPGLAGLAPTLRVLDGVIRLEADPTERPPAPWTQWLLLPSIFVPWLGTRLMNWWSGRRQRAAQVSVAELRIPGIDAELDEGVELRLRYVPLVNFGEPMKPLLEVALLRDGSVVKSWQPEALATEPWPAGA